MSRANWLSYMKYGAVAAGVYSIPVIIFLKTADYRNTWLLFSGCLLFLFIIVFFLFSFNKKKRQNAAAGNMLLSGLMVTSTGVLISVVICFLLLLIFIPGFLGHGTTQKVLRSGPSNLVMDKTGGLAFMVFMTTIMGNFSAGSFVSILFPFALKKDQTKEKDLKKQPGS